MTAFWAQVVVAIVAGTAVIAGGAIVFVSWTSEVLRETATNDLATRRVQLRADALRADYEIRLLAKRTSDVIRDTRPRS